MTAVLTTVVRSRRRADGFVDPGEQFPRVLFVSPHEQPYVVEPPGPTVFRRRYRATHDGDGVCLKDDVEILVDAGRALCDACDERLPIDEGGQIRTAHRELVSQ